MKIIEFTTEPAENKAHWLEQMRRTDWDAGQYLHWLAENETFGADTHLLLLADGDALASFCTYAESDEIDDPSMAPWIGFVYTFPEHRGHRYSGMLIAYAVQLAKAQGRKQIFVSSEEKGLYEKYGFRFLKNAQSIHDYETQIFVCDL